MTQMCRNLTTQVRSIAAVTTAVAMGDLGQKVEIEVGGEIETLKNTVNGMVEQVRSGNDSAFTLEATDIEIEQLRTFASEVTRVALEVGTYGILGGQAKVHGVSGTWEQLTHNVNVSF
jgi:osomolarity two-component system, sensor histidine kinase NIK1